MPVTSSGCIAHAPMVSAKIKYQNIFFCSPYFSAHLIYSLELVVATFTITHIFILSLLSLLSIYHEISINPLWTYYLIITSIATIRCIILLASMNGHQIKNLLDTIDVAGHEKNHPENNDDFWFDAGANLLCFCDDIIEKGPESVNNWIPKDSPATKSDIFSQPRPNQCSTDSKKCILEALFTIIKKIPNPNEPFNNSIWSQRLRNDYGSQSEPKLNGRTKSFYELALSYICSLTSQMFPDRFVYLECLLLRNVFDTCNICSLLAADVLTFVSRLLKPEYRIAVSQLTFNLCKQAPPNVISIPLSLIQRILDQYDDDGHTRKIFEHRNNYSKSLEAFYGQQ